MTPKQLSLNKLYIFVSVLRLLLFALWMHEAGCVVLGPLVLSGYVTVKKPPKRPKITVNKTLQILSAWLSPLKNSDCTAMRKSVCRHSPPTHLCNTTTKEIEVLICDAATKMSVTVVEVYCFSGCCFFLHFLLQICVCRCPAGFIGQGEAT